MDEDTWIGLSPWRVVPMFCKLTTRADMDAANDKWHKDRSRATRKANPAGNTDHGYRKPFKRRDDGRKIGFK